MLNPKKVVFTLTSLEKNVSVGRDFLLLLFFFFFFLQPKQLKCTYWQSQFLYCFVNIFLENMEKKFTVEGF